jgi:hypothetical protein
MTTTYIRRFNFKDSLSDAEVVGELKFLLEDVVPAVLKVPGVRSCRLFSGNGALRADLTAIIEMDDAGVYERLIVDAQVRQMLGRVYGNWDLKTATQTFRRELTAELIGALSSTG